MARIVCLDDERNMREVLALVFRRAGHEAWATDSSEEALSRIRSGDVDLLVQDIMRPKMDGLTLLRILRGDPKWADFPVIIVSQGAPRMGPSTGGLGADPLIFADAWFPKPWIPKELVRAVADALEARVARRSHTGPAEGGAS
jgi:CheY-like chemotaxis protein